MHPLEEGGVDGDRAGRTGVPERAKGMRTRKRRSVKRLKGGAGSGNFEMKTLCAKRALFSFRRPEGELEGGGESGSKDAKTSPCGKSAERQRVTRSEGQRESPIKKKETNLSLSEPQKGLSPPTQRGYADRGEISRTSTQKNVKKKEKKVFYVNSRDVKRPKDASSSIKVSDRRYKGVIEWQQGIGGKKRKRHNRLTKGHWGEEGPLATTSAR